MLLRNVTQLISYPVFGTSPWYQYCHHQLVRHQESFIMRALMSQAFHLLVLWTVCSYAFVLLSSAASSTTTAALFPVGSSQRFTLETTVLLNELTGPVQGKFVGYQVKADVSVKSRWGHPSHMGERLLQVQVRKCNTNFFKYTNILSTQVGRYLGTRH